MGITRRDFVNRVRYAGPASSRPAGAAGIGFDIMKAFATFMRCSASLNDVRSSNSHSPRRAQ